MTDASLATIGAILVGMAVLALVESAVPLSARGRWSRAHLGPNLALTFVTFATSWLFGAWVVLALMAARARGLGLLQMVPLPSPIAGPIAVLGLDFSFYVAHRAMHARAGLWRFHRVHHSDPAVDVTTTIRQHPGESVIRYAVMSVAALVLGASPGAFAVYRVWSALNGLLEHANVRVPQRLDGVLSLVVATPNMHKVHHSRRLVETNSNYGNIFSLFDHLLATFTPPRRGLNVAYGLDGFDDPVTQTTAGLLALPFRSAGAGRALARAGS